MDRRRTVKTMAVAAGLVWAMGAGFVPDAAAACFGTAGAKAQTPAKPAPRAAFAAAAQGTAARVSMVGLWQTEFLIGDGPNVYDQMFQQYHEGGTETSLSNGLPPALGNVCMGIWKATGPHTIVVRHVAWNWTADGALAGTFLLQFEVTLDADGLAFAGRWSAKNYDVDNTHLPDLDAAGVVRGSRIGFE